MAAVKNLELWLRPALLLCIWILVAGFTVVELATIGPLLGGVPEVSHSGRPGHRLLEARAQAPRHRLVTR